MTIQNGAMYGICMGTLRSVILALQSHKHVDPTKWLQFTFERNVP